MTRIASPATRLPLALAAAALLAAALFAGPVRAAEGEPEIGPQDWSFAGPFGRFDPAQLQRGYKVYKEVCAACHSMQLLHFRNLGQPGGPGFSEAAVKALAASVEVTDGPNDEGEMFTRPGRPADRFPSPFKNDQAARAANNGALPPDLSVITKARGIHRDIPWYLEPYYWAADIVTGYEEKGADYLYALLTGYKEAPSGMKMSEGMIYNTAFPGHQIAMPAPLSAEQVEYTDGTAPTVENYARDVTAFLYWAGEPTLMERRKVGFRMMIYLVLLAGFLYFAKRRVWSTIAH